MPPQARRPHVQSPPRRAGARRRALAPAVRDALREEARRLAGLEDAAERVRAVGDFFAALDRGTERVAAVRLAAVGELHRSGLSYDAIATRTRLSKARVAQLVREERARRA